MSRSPVRGLVIAGAAVLVLAAGAGVFLERGLLFGRHADPHASPTPSPSGSAHKAPPVKRAGILTSPALAAGGTSVVAFDSSSAWVSADRARTWKEVKLPDGAASLVVDPKDPAHWIVGGTSVSQSADSGATWKAAAKQPPGGGSFIPLAISPLNKAIWFVVANGHLYRTLDGGTSWKPVAGLPKMGVATMAGTTQARFLLGIGGQFFELTGNGAAAKALPNLPSGSIRRLAVVGADDPPEVVASGDAGHAYALRGGKWQEISGGVAGPVAGTSTGKGWVGNGGMKIGSPGQLEVTQDGGKTWKAAQGLPPDESVEAIVPGVPGGRLVYAYCAGGDIYLSSDAGLSWRLASTALRTKK